MSLQEREAALPSVDAATLARLLGVSPKEIYDLAKAGVIARGAGRLFEVEDSVQRYCEWLRGQMAGAARAAE
jgi:phage terminase Nu1 subunit (DNA packaging protein)